MAVIYSIKFNCTEGVYIGSTIQDPKQRYREHLSGLRNNKHHAPALQNKFNQYGIDSLVFNIIDECPDNDRFTLEQWYIDVFNGPWKLLNGSVFVQPIGKTKKTKEEKDRTRDTLLNNPVFWEKMNSVNARSWGDLVSPDNKVYRNVHNLRRFSISHGQPYSKMKDMGRGVVKSCNGWRRYTDGG